MRFPADFITKEKKQVFAPARRSGALAIFLCMLGVAIACGCRNTTRLPPRASIADGSVPPAWSQSLEAAGLPNLRKVSEALYGGAQPTAEGPSQLLTMGVRTVVCLRTGNCDTDSFESFGLACHAIPMSVWNPRDDQVIEFLRVATDDDNLPMFVHCEHGADRTGLMCAMYRVAVQGWTKEQAIDEMTRGGFGFHPLCLELVAYVREANIAELQRQVGIGSLAQHPADRKPRLSLGD